MNEDWLYLDNNASTPMDPAVVESMTECLQCQGHPSSPHPHGQKASAAIEQARRQVAAALGCESADVVFGSGSTEAANHVIKGVAFADPQAGPLHFISSVVDHAATLAPLKFLERFGHSVTLLEVDRFGIIDLGQLRRALQRPTALVTLIHGQNELGTVQPLEEVGRLCAEHRVLFHVDASQSFGKVPFTVSDLRADFLNIAGHKIYGPKGVGALYIKPGRHLEPLLHGGGHEGGTRSGTPAPQLIAGLGAACELVEKLGPISKEPAELLWTRLSESLGDKVTRNGHPEHRLPNVLHLTFEGVHGRELLNQARISASTGAACHSASVSPVLKALGLTPQQAAGSVRLSCGRQTTTETILEAAGRLIHHYHALAGQGVNA